MKALIDTNIVIDVISKREGYEDSLEVFKRCELGLVQGYISTITINDAIYILRKHVSQEGVRVAVQTLLLIIDIADILKSDIISAFSSEMTDFEDAIQASCAKRIKAEYIITKNIKDFKGSSIPAVLPKSILSQIKKPVNG